MSSAQELNIIESIESTGRTENFLAVNHRNVALLRPTTQFQTLLWKKYIWHRFKVPDVHNYEAEYILDVILQQVTPVRFLPVLYQKHEGNLYFLSTNCRIAIEKLCDNLLIIVDNKNKHTFKLEIDLGAYLASHLGGHHTCVLMPVNRALLKRICQPEKTDVDLSSFHNDSELKDKVYCPLRFPSNFYFIIECIKVRLVKNLHYLNLSNNSITELNDFFDVWYDNLQCLDLRNNKISDIKYLQKLKVLKHLHTLWLDGNPVCAEFDSPQSYAKVVKQFVPGIKILDGVDITKDFSLSERNYMIQSNEVCQDFVNQFLECYFNSYDSENRDKLSAMYHKDALFSMTTEFLIQESTSSTTRLFEYYEKSRNQLKVSDYNDSSRSLYCGNECIAEVLCSLPSSQHDPYSFAVTVPVITNDTVVVSVLGVFRESEKACPKSFTRLFVLSVYETLDYRITNEMLHISNATTEQAINSFKYEKPPVDIVPLPKSKRNFSDEEKHMLTNVLCSMTEMKAAWSRKCLTECNWEMKEALLSFTELYRKNQIPLEAFRNQCLTECNWEMKEALLSFTELYRKNQIPLEAFRNQ